MTQWLQWAPVAKESLCDVKANLGNDLADEFHAVTIVYEIGIDIHVLAVDGKGRPLIRVTL